MVKYSVKDHPHAPAVDLFHQTDEQFIAGFQIFQISDPLLVQFCVCIVHGPFRQDFLPVLDKDSKMRINIIVILDIILMVGGRYKQRVKINHLHTQLLQIIQLFHHALKVAPVKSAHIHGMGHFIPVLHFSDRLADVDVLPVFDIIFRISIIKTVHENLIHDSAFCPVRCGKSRYDPERIMRLDVIRYASPVIITHLISAMDLKIIRKHFRAKLPADLIIIKYAA